MRTGIAVFMILCFLLIVVVLSAFGRVAVPIVPRASRYAWHNFELLVVGPHLAGVENPQAVQGVGQAQRVTYALVLLRLQWVLFRMSLRPLRGCPPRCPQ